MVELADVESLPIGEVVALLACGAETALVRILMTGRAPCRQAQIRPAQIFDFDRTAILRINLRGSVTLVALNSGVLSL